MKHICVVRGGSLWRENYGLDADFSKEIAQEWNRTFSTSYIDFRKKLRTIHEKSVEKINFDLVTDVNDPILPSLISAPGSMIFPTDDDDWFSPRLLAVIKNFETSDKKTIRWNFGHLDLAKFTAYGENRNGGIFFYQTNNYCLKTPCSMDAIIDHAVCDRRAYQKDENYINETLSVQNWNFSSRSMLYSREESLLQSYKRFYNIKQIDDLPDEFKEYFEELCFVCNKLTVNHESFQ